MSMAALEELFRTVLQMSLTGCFVILIVLLARLCLKRVPRIFSYCLWAVVLFRLCCPVSFESSLSLVPQLPRQTARQSVSQTVQTPPAATGTPSTITLPAVSPSTPPKETEMGQGRYQPTAMELVSLLWAVGGAAILGGGILSCLRLKKRLRGAVLREDGVYEVLGLETPFVFGLLHPRIYLPQGLDTAQQRYILLHEQTHIRRKDYLIKPIAFLVLCLHWFNPLCWLAFRLMSADMEASCDERVLALLGGGVKKEYSAALLSLAAGKRIWNGGPLAFGEGSVRSRIRNVLHYRKPAFWIVLVSVLAVAALAVLLAANPAGADREELQQLEQTASASVRIVENQTVVKEGELPSGQLFQLRELLSEGRKALRKSVNDTPSAESWLQFTLSSETGSSTYYAYEQQGRCYLEQPYSFIRRIDGSCLTALTEMAENLRQTMTMEDVRALAAKGEALSWQDLDRYFCTGISNNPCVRQYPLEEGGWSLLAGSDTADSALRYATLSSPFGGSTDIRYGDLEAFLSEENSRAYPDTTAFTTDLTGDGEEERILVDFTGLEDGNGNIDLSVSLADGTVIWQQMASTSHAGHVSWFLCTLEDGPCLMRYSPYAAQGAAEYSYEVFRLSSAGQMQLLDQSSIFFALDAGPHGFQFDPEEISSFVETVNGYLAQSTLLCSTVGGAVSYSTPEMPATTFEYMDWLDNADLSCGRDANLLTRLTAYRDEVLTPAFREYNLWILCDRITGSISLADGELSLIIPEDADPETFALQVSGRLAIGEGSMSWHAFEEETASGSWIPGKTYAADIDPNTVVSIDITLSVNLPDSSVFTRIICYTPNESGQLTMSMDDEYTPPPLDSISSDALPVSLHTFTAHLSRFVPEDVSGMRELPCLRTVLRWNDEPSATYEEATDGDLPQRFADRGADFPVRVADGAILNLDFGSYPPGSISVEKVENGVRSKVEVDGSDFVLLRSDGEQEAFYHIRVRWDNGHELLFSTWVTFV